MKIVPKKYFYFPVVKYCFQFFFSFWRTRKCFKKQFLKRAFIIVWKILFIVSWAIILKSGLLSYHLLNGGSIRPSTLPSDSFYIKWIMVRVRHLCPCMHEMTPRYINRPSAYGSKCMPSYYYWKKIWRRLNAIWISKLINII